GTIATQLVGANGFGYDPIFKVDELGKTFGEASITEKQKYSHRGKAVEKLITCLVNNNIIKKMR
ncbi:MAG TPA: non-canonical purine NTP pyrophosphatase, partial [Firmicutes bacterium]|nr:non-canonical purine NTP pyrophosphatase [Bacillota bacterium]